MANHGYVRSKRRITKDVDKALADINEKFLFGKLVVEYSHHPDNPHGWGLHVWEIYVDGQPYESRIMWLKDNKTKTFEIRHGGGGDFIWWVDHLIRNAVAEVTEGMIFDDGCDGRWPILNILPNLSDNIRFVNYSTSETS